VEDRVEAGVGDVMQGCGELGGRTVFNVESGLTGVRPSKQRGEDQTGLGFEQETLGHRPSLVPLLILNFVRKVSVLFTHQNLFLYLFLEFLYPFLFLKKNMALLSFVRFRCVFVPTWKCAVFMLRSLSKKSRTHAENP
jgi:hypothetical protein